MKIKKEVKMGRFSLITLLIICMCFSNNVFSNENQNEFDFKFSGFGSLGIGKLNNNTGYAWYEDDSLDWNQETLLGIQLDLKFNDKIKFVTQAVTTSRYDYDVKLEMAYASYDFDSFTARAGKLRLPLFFYSEYLDLGYAMPMLRPSQELYEKVVLKSYEGVELLIPINFEDSTLLLQPLMGTAIVDEDDSHFGDVDLDDFRGLSVNWTDEYLTLRGSYFVATANPQCNDNSESCQFSAILDDKKGKFISMGAQYVNYRKFIKR